MLILASILMYLVLLIASVVLLFGSMHLLEKAGLISTELTPRRGPTPRYYVTCKDISNYANRVGRIQSEQLSNIKKEYCNRTCQYFSCVDGRWYNEYDFEHSLHSYNRIKKQLRWSLDLLHKTCKERGLNYMRGEHHKKPHI